MVELFRMQFQKQCILYSQRIKFTAHPKIPVGILVGTHSIISMRIYFHLKKIVVDELVEF